MRVPSKTVLVYATTLVTVRGGGKATGINLTKGQQINLSATGQITYGPDYNCYEFPKTYPNGDRINTKTGKPCASKIDPYPGLPSALSPIGSLLWRVGRIGWSEAGEHRVITAPEGGQLFLGVNDYKPQDNSGYFTVHLEIAK